MRVFVCVRGVCVLIYIKVIIATNAAESSITLPDVDCVICLGTHKALQYDSRHHRVQLINTWISKASATQRAGRTGRVRPGTVYRLYSTKLYDSFPCHEQSEIHRKPLQDVILGLRHMLEESVGFEGVKPILCDLLEPPGESLMPCVVCNVLTCSCAVCNTISCSCVVCGASSFYVKYV